jgi:O-methyltransferase involved in polyketide biosynthesis
VVQARLKGVPETMLIPIRARYLESKKEDGILSDPKTIEILDRIECDFSGKKEISLGTQLGVSIRTEILDEQVNRFLAKNPNAVVVNLGCGLDTRFHRLDNGYVTWYDLDVPEAIELRRNFFSETDRFRFISKSVTEFSWLETIPKNEPLLFIAEGLLMYFTESEVKEILRRIGSSHGKAEMLLEAMSPFIAKRTRRHVDVKQYHAPFKWGIKTGADLEQWNHPRNDNPKLTHLDHGKLTHPWVWLWVSSAVLPDLGVDRLTTEEAVGDRSCQPRARS